MSKYSQKIESFLTDIDPSIKLTKPISENISIKNIYNSVLEAKKTNVDIKIISQKLIKMIHTRDEYPLSYIFFKCLYETELLNRVLSHPPNITDLHTFMDWHRENIEYVNFDAIHNLMDDIIKNQDTKQNKDKKEELLNEFDNIDDTPQNVSDEEIEKSTNNAMNKFVEIIDQINELDIYEELKTVYTLMFKTTGVRKILHDSIYNNKFISIDIQYDLESVDLEYVECIINNRHKLNIFVPKGKLHPDLKKVATTIIMMENLAKIYNIEKELPVVNLTIIFSDQKKNVYHWTNTLCCDNINSGSTYPGKSIVCWRREEFQKVLIHELFHYYKLDFYQMDPYYQQLNTMIHIPKITGTDMLNESYTESCTTLILIVFRYLMNIQTDNPILINQNNEFNDYFIKYLKIEIAFIMFQVAKIITIFGGDSFEDMVTKKIVIKQNTSFRSYFLIKLILLCNTDSLLNTLNESMIMSNERLILFGELINDSWNNFVKNTHNLQIINNFIKQIKKAYEKEDDKWIFKTCRMSVNDTI